MDAHGLHYLGSCARLLKAGQARLAETNSSTTSNAQYFSPNDRTWIVHTLPAPTLSAVKNAFSRNMCNLVLELALIAFLNGVAGHLFVVSF